MSQMNSDIKSTAIVKFAAVEMPAKFRQLQINTDLKQPPANWLQGNSKLENNLRNLTFGKGHFFSSFKIAHCYPDLTGEIDVVSDAENIKRLLKIPYSDGHVSMMVHRVANTLLLDDFDIHKHLLRQQQKDWQWLRKFYYETVVESMQERIKNKMRIIKKNKSRDHLQNLNMFSKFLYYSIGTADDHTSNQTEQCSKSDPQGAALSSANNDMIPDLFPQTENLRPEQQRTFQWTFEDIRMLIGTDLPIFGGRTHPCISLRLRDQCNPINVLTGLDYWLDNLMCNVPEMAMCYHLDGIVQNYEVIKTEEIPKMPNSEFSPTVVKDIAQNILSFLKSNATKEGHTYWLFKGHGDDVVKLYDLTTLCADLIDDENINPFTVPVGILLYRVARNMQQNHGRRKSGTVKTLLNKCLLLLDRKSHPQVVTSARFLLSDLYVPDNIYNLENSPDTSDDSDPEDYSPRDAEQDVSDDQTTPVTSVDVQGLCLPEMIRKRDETKDNKIRHLPVTGTVEERCRQAIQHIAEGLSCLDNSLSKERELSETSESTQQEDIDKQAKCDPNEAIPLHYQPIRKQVNQTAANGKMSPSSPDPDSIGREQSPEPDLANQMTVFNRSLLPQGSWHRQSKSLLIRKAAIAYYGLTEAMMASDRYLLAWKHITLALHCFRTLEIINPEMAGRSKNLLCVILSLYGDVHLMIARHTELVTSQRSEVNSITEEDSKVVESLNLEMQPSDDPWLVPLSFRVEDNLEQACRCYRKVLDEAGGAPEPDDPQHMVTMVKRYGNILNELGVFYMNQSTSVMTEQTDKQKALRRARELWQSSESCFFSGIKEFAKLNDALNMALLHSNLGRLYRLCAQGVVQGLEAGDNKREFTPEEAQYFTKAQDSYREALSLLDSQSNKSQYWDSISWELCSTYFTMATLLQDYAPLSTKAQEQVEREVIKLMEKALSLCEAENRLQENVSYMYRAATIHHRLASLYHSAYRNQVDDRQVRHLRTEAERHYEMARDLFSQTDNSCILLRVQLERVALYEYQLQRQTSPVIKLRTLCQALAAMTACHSAVKSLGHQVAAPEQGDGEEPEDVSLREEAEKLIGIFVSRLQFVGLNLVKYSSPKSKKTVPPSSSQSVRYKEIYAVILKGTSVTGEDLTVKCQRLSDTLSQIDKLCANDVRSTADEKLSKSPMKCPEIR